MTENDTMVMAMQMGMPQMNGMEFPQMNNMPQQMAMPQQFPGVSTNETLVSLSIFAWQS